MTSVEVLNVKVFIIHASFMDVRKQRIESLITSLSEKNEDVAFSFEYINEYDPVAIKQDDIAAKVSLTKQNNGELYDSLIRNMHINQLSNSLKHALAVEKASKMESCPDMFIILEDDVLYGDDVMTRLVDVVKMVAKDPEIDIMFLGLPSLVPIPPSDKPTFRKVSEFFRMFPCCDSYIFTKDCLKKMLPKVYPIKYTQNIQLSWIAEECKLKCLMTTPNVFLDGSKYGAYLSAVDPNSKLVFNPEFNKLAQIVAKGHTSKYTPEEEKTIDAEFETIKFRNHPDVMHLAALYNMAKGDYKKAESILDNIYGIITQNGCIINGDTEFLRTYARLYKHTQDA
jgi:hypothetical protein